MSTLNIPSKISTPRLTLLRLTNTSPSHPHVQLFHENWSDPDATAWSLRGATKSLSESRDWMIEHRSKYDNIFYSIFAKPQPDTSDTPATTTTGQKIWTVRDVQAESNEQKQQQAEEEEKSENEILGVHVGSVSLRLPPRPASLPSTTTSTTSNSNQDPAAEPNDTNLRILGYALFRSAWGKGYATEANRAMLDAYAAAVPRDERGAKKYQIEGGVDEGNDASEKVLQKLGFEKVGWRDEEKVWLNGAWRAGYWVYVMDV